MKLWICSQVSMSGHFTVNGVTHKKIGYQIQLQTGRVSKVAYLPITEFHNFFITKWFTSHECHMVELYISCLVFPFGGVAADPHGCQTSAVPLSTPSCLCKFMFVRPILFLDTKGKPVSSSTIKSIPILQQQFAPPPQKKEPHRQQESPLRFYGNDKKCWHCLDLDFFPSSATFPLPCFSSWHLSSTCILYIYFCCWLSVSTYRLGTYNLHKDI